MSGLVFKNISKRISDSVEFANFNLEIDDGEFVALVGPDGCGNAELIRMAEGYGGSYSGDVLIDGRRVTRNSRGANIASLVNDMPRFGTPRSEMLRILRAIGYSAEDAKRRIENSANTAGVAAHIDTPWSRLDPENRLRAGLARACAAGSKVVLMQEPFAGADNRTAARMRHAIMDFRDQVDMIFVMSTSCAMSAMSLATRVVVMKGGAVQQSDTSQNIYDYPADRYVAELFGNNIINIIPAKLERVGEEVHAVFGENRILIPEGKLARMVDKDYIGGEVLLGVRPENIRYEQVFVSLSPESTVEAHVRHIELLGSETYLHLDFQGVSDQVIARVDPRCIAIIGGSIQLAIDSNRIHMFDAKTDKSILSRH